MAEFYPIPTHVNFKDRTGCRYGRLVVLKYAGKRGTRTLWMCRCDCGAEVICQANALAQGTKSCGCLKREPYRKTHGMKNTKEYQAWCHMRNRCYNQNVARFPRYGGRGIIVCDRWRESFENFFADIGKAPSTCHSLDRIDNNGNYEPGNVRWSSHTTQAQNRRTNRRLTVGGKTLCIAEWSKLSGIRQATILKRLSLGWFPERAVAQVVDHRFSCVAH